MKTTRIQFYKITTVLLITSFFTGSTYSQLSQRTGFILSEIEEKISDMPGDSGDEYAEPSDSQLDIWADVLNELFTGDYISAATTANTIGYDLVEFQDTTSTPNTTYYMLETASSNYWGTYVYNPSFCRPLVIQSPHAIRDANTGLQGVHIFHETEAIFYQVNGTHRCNSSAFSFCTGTTSSCSSSSEPYRISDLAHTTQSIFQKTTEVLLNAFEDSHFIQLHGFTKQDTDPYVILSNGTQVEPATDFISLFSQNLALEDSVLTFRIAHIDTDWTRLRGFWNTQGRLINQHPTPCDADATNSEGRFFHVEQERTRLRNDIEGWDKVANALSNTFACLISSNTEIEKSGILDIYPNPTSGIVQIRWSDPKISSELIKVFNVLGQDVSAQVSIGMLGLETSSINMSSLTPGLYFLKAGNDLGKVYKE